MWANFKFALERDRALKAIRNSGEIIKEYKEKMPLNVQQVIQICCAKEPKDRKDSTEMLQSDLIPSSYEDEEFKKFCSNIQYHKTKFSNKLMKFLMLRPNPKLTNVTYDLDYVLQRRETEQTRDQFQVKK